MKTLTLLFLVALSIPALAQAPEQPGATSNVAVRGSLSKEEVREVISRHANEARCCYQRATSAVRTSGLPIPVLNADQLA